MRVLVVGAGVIGLTCAVRLAEAGHDTHVLARDLPAETTSAVAPAIWHPERTARPDRARDWAARTYAVLSELSERPGSGVRMREGTELLPPGAPAEPGWRPAGPTPRTVPDPAPGHARGWRYAVPVADSTAYLDHLVDRLERAGGTVTRHWLAELPTAGVVVNATGLASRAVADDSSLRPVRGQVVQVAQAGLEEWWRDPSAESPLYVVPREHDVVVGGGAEPGRWDLRPDPEAARALLERAGALVPALRGAKVLGLRVGLAPGRAAVRLEAVRRADGEPGGVVHCYGHGGAGLTLSWGCADDVLTEVDTLAGRDVDGLVGGPTTPSRQVGADPASGPR